MGVTYKELDELKTGDKVYIKPYKEIKDTTLVTENRYNLFAGIPLTVLEIDEQDLCLVRDDKTNRTLIIQKYVIESIRKKHDQPESTSKVHHPNHYNQNGMEVWDVIEAFTSNLSGVEAFYAGNAIKYILRWDKKNGVEDLEKAKVYIDKIIEGRKEK